MEVPIAVKKIVNKLTDRVHWVGSQFENAVKDQITALEEAVAPIPSVILDDIMSLSLDP